MNNIQLRHFNHSSLFIVLSISMVISIGQHNDVVLSNFAIRLILTIIFAILSVIKPVLSINLICFGYFIPLILEETKTLLPANFWYYIFISLLSLFYQNFIKIKNLKLNNKILYNTKINTVYFVYLFIIILSEIQSFALHGRSLGFSLNYFLCFLLGIIVTKLINQKNDEDILLMVLVAVGCFFSGWVIFGPAKLDATGGRFTIGFDQNYYSLFIGFSIIVLTSFLIFHRASLKVYTTIIFIVFLLFNWIAIFRLGSRGVFIALIVAIIWLLVKNSKNLLRLITNFFVGCALFLLIFNLPGMGLMKNRFLEKEVAHANHRLPLALNSLECIFSSSLPELLIGTGSGGGMQSLKKYYGSPTSPHNQYLETAMDYGIIGLALLIYLIYLGYKYSLRQKLYSRDIRIGLIIFVSVGFLSLTPLRHVLPWIVIGFTLSFPVNCED